MAQTSAVTAFSNTAAVRKLEYCLSKILVSPRIRDSVARIKEAYERDTAPWVIGYSGGKDSSAVLKLIFHALRLVRCHHKLVTVVYCDTGVEIPIATDLAKDVIYGFQKEAHSFGLPISTKVLNPRMQDRFFVKVIGRGYPPPTDKFRWCTDRLRINPVSDFLKSVDAQDAIVVLGVRNDESSTRNLTLSQNSTGDPFWKVQKGHNDRRLFMPILDFRIEDVWKTLLQLSTPYSVQGAQVADLYSSASGECPTLRDPVSPPCGHARFGCWTCTVAKKSQTLDHLASAGHSAYVHLQNYRTWLATTRSEPRFRWKHRRNGAKGLGPMTLTWRRMALERLLAIQRKSGKVLIDQEEINIIKKLWSDDARGKARA